MMEGVRRQKNVTLEVQEINQEPLVITNIKEDDVIN